MIICHSGLLKWLNRIQSWFTPEVCGYTCIENKYFFLFNAARLPFGTTPKLKIGGNMFFWANWFTKRVVNINFFFENNVLVKYRDLQTTYNLDNKYCWKFLQIRDCLSKRNLFRPHNLLIESPALFTFKKIGKLTHLISLIYKYFTESINVVNSGLQRVWEIDLRKTFEEDEWGTIIKKMLKPMRDAQPKLIQFKILNKLHWTPLKLNKAGMCDVNHC